MKVGDKVIWVGETLKIPYPWPRTIIEPGDKAEVLELEGDQVILLGPHGWSGWNHIKNIKEDKDESL